MGVPTQKFCLYTNKQKYKFEGKMKSLRFSSSQSSSFISNHKTTLSAVEL